VVVPEAVVAEAVVSEVVVPETVMAEVAVPEVTVTEVAVPEVAVEAAMESGGPLEAASVMYAGRATVPPSRPVPERRRRGRKRDPCDVQRE
jgi:hypothetical protein